ncbi:CCR4-Not complex CAF1 family ribonulcease subunit Caf1 [Schizosaccharomyces japonicus yFS275]|uniref:poly(A)-specific ribonuclease n=1 Tax=Schizosaccharomyces japonicus (strain yFS275 / FY16936) TaxID=402676 RepID=B6K6R9_SCHJY|nr:CCR4-Not complex CAF1 family ribonulcease subunit Caf1 [Schizosaccharomyces japonicus yFS275]EEB09223.1 CCR4-Not complex CAF1 family ribonulcease subunit Caf1 [Schizosaccharomyces japonicus yFS275]
MANPQSTYPPLGIPIPNAQITPIRDVWAQNLEQEFLLIMDLIDRYPIVSMDTEFPGVVARPMGVFKSSADYHYQTLRTNVDSLKIIQIGISLCDWEGNFPSEALAWQFNFQFSLQDDIGIDFKKHQEFGIRPVDFGELLIASGLVLLEEVTWITFHSGYDFGYLLKVMTQCPLPSEYEDFYKLLCIYFPNTYDIKYIMKAITNTQKGLQDIADDFQITRIGPQHQAGSDSLLTAQTFFEMCARYYDGKIDPNMLGQLYGLGTANSSLLMNTPSTPKTQFRDLPGIHPSPTMANTAISGSQMPSSHNPNLPPSSATPMSAFTNPLLRYTHRVSDTRIS